MKKYLTDESVKKLFDNFKLEKAEKISEGKSKIVYKTADSDICIMQLKPSLRSITYNRQENIAKTDIERAKTTLLLMTFFEKNNLPTQLLYDKLIAFTKENTTEYFLLVKPAKTVPIEWISRLYAAGSIVKLFPTLVKAGDKFKSPLQKYDFKQDINVCGIDDPTLNESYITGLDLLTEDDLLICKCYLSKISELLDKTLKNNNCKLIDFKIEFGKDITGSIILIDEISQDCMRVNDNLGNSITKDTFRQGKTKEDVLLAYERFTNNLKFDSNQIMNLK